MKLGQTLEGEGFTDTMDDVEFFPAPTPPAKDKTKIPAKAKKSTSTSTSTTGKKTSTKVVTGSDSLIPPEKKWCYHSGYKVVVRVGEVTFGGAAGSRVHSGCAVLVVDMAGGAAKWIDNNCSFPAKYESLRAFMPVPTPRIEIDWQDRGAPPMDRGFFEALPHMVGKGHVIINCHGGHGRTGTALAALLIIHHKMSAVDAIHLVRVLHCEQAVESKEQVQWRCDLAGLGEKVKA